MTLQTTSQHGVPFDPVAAKKAREASKTRVQVEAREASPQARLDGSHRERARYLDQMESAWKERARDRRS